MGITLQSYELFNKFLQNLDRKELSILELGDQDIYDSRIAEFKTKFRNLISKQFKIWKTIDLTDSYGSGVEIIDLSIPTSINIQFDIITNFGTTEHVEPESGQYTCWNNINDLLKVGGLLINEVPTDNGYWYDHCRYFYTDDFFYNLENYGFSLIENKILDNKLHFSVLKKIEHKKFMSESIFFQNIVFRKENNSTIIAQMNNPKSLIF